MWLKDELWDALEKQAVALERSVNWLIGKAVAESVRKLGDQKGGKKG